MTVERRIERNKNGKRKCFTVVFLLVQNENQSVFENFFAIEIGGLLFAFSNILWKIRLEIRESSNWIC